MSLFAVLHVGILTSLLSEWCSENMLLKLDSAVCNKVNRKYLMDVFGNFAINGDIVETLSSLKWVALRKMKLKVLSLKKFQQKNFSFKDLNLSRVIELNVGSTLSYPDSELILLVNGCTDLRVLCAHDKIFTKEVLLHIDRAILAQLTSIKSDESCTQKMAPECVRHLVAHCTQLRSLNLSKVMTIDQICELIEVNFKTLTDFQWGSTEFVPMNSDQLLAMCTAMFARDKPKVDAVDPNSVLNLFMQLAKCESSLETVIIGFSHMFCLEGYKAVIAACPNLKVFEYNSSGDNNTFTIKIDRHLVDESKLEMYLYQAGVKDTSVCEMIEQLVGFHHVKLRLFDLSDLALSILARNNPDMKHLMLYETGKVCTYDGLSHLFSECRNLEELVLCKFDKLDVGEEGDGYPNTVKLLCSGVLNHVTNLSLDLYFSLLTHEVISILNVNQQLVKLSLWKCYDINPQYIENYVKKSGRVIEITY